VYSDFLNADLQEVFASKIKRVQWKSLPKYFISAQRLSELSVSLAMIGLQNRVFPMWYVLKQRNIVIDSTTYIAEIRINVPHPLTLAGKKNESRDRP
jgi:hypothetical protein